MLRRYARWLHTGWPAGTVERLPELGDGGTCSVAGVRVTGDLTGIPLLKFSADSGARAARAIAGELGPRRTPDDRSKDGTIDVAIIGGGVSGIAAAIEAKKLGLSFVVFEAAQPFSTIANFPREKPIYTYPTDMEPAGDMRFAAKVKEETLRELEEQRTRAGIETVAARIDRLERRGGLIVLHHADGKTTEARRAIVAIGQSGNFRRLGVAGEDLGKVSNRLHDPKAFTGADVLVVGGGDSAAEAAIALAIAGARVTLSYRKPELSRPKAENVAQLEALAKDPLAPAGVEHPTSERRTTAFTRAMAPDTKPGSLELALATEVVAIEPERVIIKDARTGANRELRNDAVFTMIGREPPLDFLRRSGIRVRGDWSFARAATFALFLAFCVFIYTWKSGGTVTQYFQQKHWFPFNMSTPADPSSLAGTIALTAQEPGFYYSIAYCACVVAFGIARIRRRRTRYVTAQTLTLIAFQLVPLFLLPYIVLPWLGHNGAFDSGAGATIADHLFPKSPWTSHGREYWRAFGFVLAWPLFVWNFFTNEPMTWWLAIGAVQTFVVIPLIVRRWGKGAYCGWVCSCGALAETLGDAHRQKMPHGPIWNRLNMTGQAILAVAFALFGLRIASWHSPGGAAERLYAQALSGFSIAGVELNYYHVVDVLLAGIVGVGCYFWFSGRVWCRFACPLAALMHVYARFSLFRIFPEKSKCISCNVCTSVCHQGIDVMSFANKGLPMADPQCVRCSACVQSCPTGVLSFGRVGRGGLPVLDALAASPVQSKESTR